MSPAPMPLARRILLAALLALVLLYGLWFGRAPQEWVALGVFGLPPALCALGVWRGARTAGLWSAVLALAWFSHGVLIAWIRPEERMHAWIELTLAVVVVFAASIPGLRARFSRKR